MASVRRTDKPQVKGRDILERKPPFDLEAEACVLGSILLKPDVCDDVAMVVRPEDFYEESNRTIFENMLGMHDTGRKIDVKLLVDRLENEGKFEQIGGAAYLARICNSVPNAAHAKYYADIVASKSTYRRLIDTCNDVLGDAYLEQQPPKELVSTAEQRVFEILDERSRNEVSTIRDVLHQAMDRIDARMRGEVLQGGVESGFADLDHLLGGLHNSELLILAARPSMGKTALAMNIAEHVAVEGQAPSLFVSLEMSANELADRLLCSAARVNSHRLRNGTLSNDDRRRLLETAAKMSQSPLFIDDSPSRTVTEIAAAARRIKRREGSLGLVTIDYLQLIEPDNSADSRQEQVARIARRLKGLARDLDVPVLCLAQVNRQAEDAKEHRPRLSHLRESGAIEQDADVVMFVHREEYFHRGEDREQYAGEAEVIIAKQRNGPVGEVKLVWQKEFTRFEDKAPERFGEFDDFGE